VAGGPGVGGQSVKEKGDPVGMSPLPVWSPVRGTTGAGTSQPDHRATSACDTSLHLHIDQTTELGECTRSDNFLVMLSCGYIATPRKTSVISLPSVSMRLRVASDCQHHRVSSNNDIDHKGPQVMKMVQDKIKQHTLRAQRWYTDRARKRKNLPREAKKEKRRKKNARRNEYGGKAKRRTRTQVISKLQRLLGKWYRDYEEM